MDAVPQQRNSAYWIARADRRYGAWKILVGSLMGWPMSDEQGSVVRKMWMEIEAGEPKFRHLYERGFEINALLARAKRVGELGLASELEVESAIFSRPISREPNESPGVEAIFETPERVELLRQRMRSPSVVVRAMAARILWNVDPASRRISGQVAVEGFLGWFQASGELAIRTMDGAWMMQALDVLRASVEMARKINARNVERQICEKVMEFSSNASRVGLGGWLHSCAFALAKVHKDVLAEADLSELFTVLGAQMEISRLGGEFHVERVFASAAFELKQAARLAVDESEFYLAVARSLEEEARVAPSAMAKTHLLKEAVDAYRKARRVDDVARASIALERENAAVGAELTPFTFSFSMSAEEVEGIIGRFDGVPIEDALERVVVEPFFRVEPDAIALEAKTRERMTPLFSLLPVQMLGPENTEYSPVDGEDRQRMRLTESAKTWLIVPLNLLAEVFRRLRMRGLDGESILKFMARGDVFVASDEPFVRRGIHHWLGGDHLSAVHVLVPLVEKVLRRICRKVERPTLRVQSDGLEQASIDTILGHLEGRIPSSLHFALKLALVERGWWALRHTVAHGLGNAGYFDERKSSYVVYLLLRMGELVAGRS